MPTLNIADLALAIIWLFFSFRGYMRGFVKEAGSLAAIIAGFYCAGTYYKALAPRLTPYISGNYAGTAAYILIFTLALLTVWFLALLVSGIVKVTMTQWADRFFGGAFGLAKGVVLTAIILFLIHLAAPHPDFLKGSTLVPLLEQVSARLVRYIPPDIHEKLRSLGKRNAARPLTKTADCPQSTALAQTRNVPRPDAKSNVSRTGKLQATAQAKAKPTTTPSPRTKKTDTTQAKAQATPPRSATKPADDTKAAAKKHASQPSADTEHHHE